MNPIIFVHGNIVDSSCWNSILEYFLEEGIPGSKLWTIDFDNVGEPHDSMAEQLEEFVDRVLKKTEASEVQLIGHSLGATGIRYWMESYDRYDAVETVIYMAGAIHGTYMCLLEDWFDDEITEPCQRISVDAMNRGNLLSDLNEGDETPGDVDYYTIRASCDRYFLMNPTSPKLKGANENVTIFTTHRGLLQNSKVKRKLVEWTSD